MQKNKNQPHTKIKGVRLCFLPIAVPVRIACVPAVIIVAVPVVTVPIIIPGVAAVIILTVGKVACAVAGRIILAVIIAARIIRQLAVNIVCV